MKRAVYVAEFCGAPGTGKSTLIAACQKELARQGFRVIRLTNIRRKKSFIGKKIRALRIRTREKLFSFYLKHNKSARSYLAYTSKYPPRAAKFIRKLLFSLFCLRFLNYRSYDYLFCDESFIQNVTSTAHDREFTKDELEWFSGFLNENIYSKYRISVVNCCLDLEENINRIEKRNQQGDWFNIGTREEKAERLKVKTRNIEEIIQRIECDRVITCDTADSDACVQKIVSSLCERIH